MLKSKVSGGFRGRRSYVGIEYVAYWIGAAVIAIVMAPAVAAQQSEELPHTFESGQPALASEVNDNFRFLLERGERRPFPVSFSARGAIRSGNELSGVRLSIGGDLGELSLIPPQNGSLSIRNSGSTERILARALESRASLAVGQSTQARINVEANDETGSLLEMRRAGGARGVEVSTGANGSEILLFRGNGGAGVYLFAGATSSSINVDGTSVGDYAEYFPLSDASALSPGMLVVIDPEQSGSLRLSTESYDRKVAGIISGAGDLNPGMVIGHKDGSNDGKPVAVSGRVFAYADASTSPIEVGDLLTTSAVPGHAMKVADPHVAQGAVVGKAMTALADGQGLVLVLVTLQ